jgi:hypothetical protein
MSARPSWWFKNRLIVGDEVYQDKGTLHVIDADGKKCKAEVLQQERLQN